MTIPVATPQKFNQAAQMRDFSQADRQTARRPTNPKRTRQGGCNMNWNAKAPAGRPGHCLNRGRITTEIVSGYYHTTRLLKSPQTAKGVRHGD